MALFRTIALDRMINLRAGRTGARPPAFLVSEMEGGRVIRKLSSLPSLTELMDLPPPLHAEGGVNLSAYPTDRNDLAFWKLADRL
jgi:hypothetical protein